VKEALELIATYGLPIVLTCWFVFRIDSVLTTLTGTMTTFIEWLKTKENERKDREIVIAAELVVLKEQNVALINKINILEIRVEK